MRYAECRYKIRLEAIDLSRPVLVSEVNLKRERSIIRAASALDSRIRANKNPAG